MRKLQIRMRTIEHTAIESDDMDPTHGTYILCECGKRAVTRDEIAKMHQRSRAVIPGVTEIDT